MNHAFGIDIGSTTTELVVINGHNLEIIFTDKAISGVDIQATGDHLIKKAREFLNINSRHLIDNDHIVVTGYGRKLFRTDVMLNKSMITEITCYGKGGSTLKNDVRVIIDIGGQDSKVIHLTDSGKVKNFVMNDKCAAGTGKFLEMIANQFNITLEELSVLSKNSTVKKPMSNICAVFAQSEIVNMISKGIHVRDIVKAAEISIVSRIYGMIEELDLSSSVMFCGGVAKNEGMLRALEEKLACTIDVPKQPEYVGAYGAALFAAEAMKNNE